MCQINTTMAQKGILTTSDYLSIDEYKRLLERLRLDEDYNYEIYSVLAFSTALRISDIKRIKWSDVVGRRGFQIQEKKTLKWRKISLSESVCDRIMDLYNKITPDKNEIIVKVSEQYLNRVLKKLKVKYNLNIGNFSTHSFRKTFARYIWEKNNRSEDSLVMLMRVLNHSSLSVTIKYLGITDDEIKNIYESIEI